MSRKHSIQQTLESTINLFKSLFIGNGFTSKHNNKLILMKLIPIAIKLHKTPTLIIQIFAWLAQKMSHWKWYQLEIHVGSALDAFHIISTRFLAEWCPFQFLKMVILVVHHSITRSTKCFNVIFNQMMSFSDFERWK
jgi:hypothetical protein